jgi:hypothetical protein
MRLCIEGTFVANVVDVHEALSVLTDRHGSCAPGTIADVSSPHGVVQNFIVMSFEEDEAAGQQDVDMWCPVSL